MVSGIIRFEKKKDALFNFLGQSLHDPLLPLNVETEVENGVEKIVNELNDIFLSKYDGLDQSCLKL